MRRETVEGRRAVEALRAGVPNRDVVRQLPPEQSDVESRFEALLQATETGWEEDKQTPGMLIAGDFGAGKSHWLEYFRHLALEGGFICSTIVLNKEIPLSDMGKVYRACVESAVAPGMTGPALEEIAHSYNSEKAAHFAELFHWVHQNKDLDPRFGACLFLFDKNPSEDLREKIIAEWTGYPMKVAELKAALKETSDGKQYTVGRSQKVQISQRFEFLSRFFYSAGYNGWVLLIDETEMISKYTLRQRAKAYAHLAELSGVVKGARLPGVAAVFTITKDFSGEVLYGRKNDRANIPARLEGTKDAEYIARAEAGMKTLEGNRVLDIRAPSPDHLQEIYEKVRSIYSTGYEWEAPELSNRREYSSSTGIRQYTRSWINTWDLRRLYNYGAEVITEDVSLSYEEDPDLQSERPAEDEEPYITI